MARVDSGQGPEVQWQRLNSKGSTAKAYRQRLHGKGLARDVAKGEVEKAIGKDIMARANGQSMGQWQAKRRRGIAKARSMGAKAEANGKGPGAKAQRRG